ncbi:MAG: glutamate 5-kinase [Thermodesulfobacterium geofontis]|uniref:Glutamate 5-kinase n=2 Tax=Thermodesulfobacterium geofontis TaxID=1295609 RepID=A0A2N7Q936_9BACT|nr:MAG: glutamate 5-kinase [Thermodesulfobacterium geofontis]
MDRKEKIQKLLNKVKKIVLKVGSAVITKEDEGLDYQVLHNLSYEINRLIKSGYKVILVSSGAIACGRAKMKYYKKPISLTEKQALAAVGQAALIQAYEDMFQQYGIKVAQILLTNEDLSQRERYINAKKTLEMLLKWGIIPIVNENDTVTTEGIRFSDNDILSALVAGTIEADILIVLSDVDSLYKEDPRINPQAERISEVEEITPEIMSMAGKNPGRLGRGGMYSKLLSAQMVNSMGIPMVILPGRMPLVIEKFWSGNDIGTIFWAKERKLSMRKLWIKYYIKPEGKLFIDEGAEKAIIENGKSLLIGGIVSIEGNFPKDACVECVNLKGKSLAKGLTNFSAQELLKLKISEDKINKEVIHRDNLVILD